MINLYRHSGKYDTTGLLSGLAAGMLLGIPIAFLYNYGIFEITSAKLRMLCPVGFGALIGAVCGGVMYTSKVRNTTVAGGVGAVSALFALYVSWVGWVLHLVFPARWVFNVLGPSLRPLALWSAVRKINATGTWGYEHGGPTTGAFLWLMWACEALAVVGFASLVAVALIKRLPFCERCNVWCRERHAIFISPVLPPAQIKTQVESQDFQQLEKFPVADKKKPHFRVELRTCGVCRSLNTLSLVQNLPRNHKLLVDKLLVTQEQATIFRDIEAKRSAGLGIPASLPAK